MEKLNLPEEFLERIKILIGEDEYEDFVKSYDKSLHKGLRRNPLKADEETFNDIMKDEDLTPIPWVHEGFYYDEESFRAGKSALHEAGLYYIQEPSAMCPAAVLAPFPGEKVLDLCAAPGGKTTQLAGSLMGTGLLVANEISESRAKILSSNVERMGITNCVVLSETPQSLAKRFPEFFDGIVVDAPCSGEGMFKKEEAAVADWTPSTPAGCAKRAEEILDCAYEMLKPGGRMVLSTCTFAPEENELQVGRLLAKYDDLYIEGLDYEAMGISPGLPRALAGSPFDGVYDPVIAMTGRIWPHKQNGEGHYIACFVKDPNGLNAKEEASAKSQSKKEVKTPLYDEFVKENMIIDMPGVKTYFGDELYLLPEALPDVDGLRCLRAGLHLGTNKKNRFEPAHALAKALNPWVVKRHYETDEPLKYLRGETLSCDETLNGWVLVTYKGLSLGWGKASKGIIKNHYPKGLRINW